MFREGCIRVFVSATAVVVIGVCTGAKMGLSFTVEARKLEHHSPHALKV